MDLEAVKLREGLASMEAMRAAALAEADGYLANLKQQLAKMAATGNRFQRRRVDDAKQRIDAFEKWYRRKMAEIVRDTTGKIDVDAGTLKAVQDEAATKLADIFK